MLPWQNATLLISLMVATALRCWVMPIAQQMTVARESRNIAAAVSIWSRPKPVDRSTSDQSRPRTCSAHSSNCAVCREMKSWSSTVPGAASSHVTSRWPMAWNSARSPLMRTGRCTSDSSVPLPSTPLTFCGLRKLSSPASRNGLMVRNFAPRRLASSSAVSMRGWLVPGFWPMITISSAS